MGPFAPESPDHPWYEVVEDTKDKEGDEEEGDGGDEDVEEELEDGQGVHGLWWPERSGQGGGVDRGGSAASIQVSQA